MEDEKEQLIKRVERLKRKVFRHDLGSWCLCHRWWKVKSQPGLEPRASGVPCQRSTHWATETRYIDWLSHTWIPGDTYKQDFWGQIDIHYLCCLSQAIVLICYSYLGGISSQFHHDDECGQKFTPGERSGEKAWWTEARTVHTGKFIRGHRSGKVEVYTLVSSLEVIALVTVLVYTLVSSVGVLLW